MARGDCPECGGTGWRVVERESGGARARVAERCACSAPDDRARLFELARIPKRYEHCRLETFDTEAAASDPRAARWQKSLVEARLIVQAFARDFPGEEGRGLLLMGPSGVGKTHLAVGAVKELLLRGHQCLFCDYGELLKRIQSSYKAGSDTSELELLEPVFSAEVLLLDDLGSSKPSAWGLETVGHILNRRYNDRRVTLATTNFLDAEAAHRARGILPSGEALRTEDSLADRVGQRIRSRLYEMCRTVEIVSLDYRYLFQENDRRRA